MGRIKQGRRTKLSSETEDLLRWAIKEQYADKLMSDLLDAGYTADDALKIAADLSIDKRIEKHIETRIEDLCIKDFASAVRGVIAEAQDENNGHFSALRKRLSFRGAFWGQSLSSFLIACLGFVLIFFCAIMWKANKDTKFGRWVERVALISEVDNHSSKPPTTTSDSPAP